MVAAGTVRDGANSASQAVADAPAERVVPKPVPRSQQEDPRAFGIGQLRRRFQAKTANLQNGTTNLAFHLKPSDPDFPFELDYLDCEVQVPASYPDAPPAVRVKNRDMPRGFAVNVERGWDQLVRDLPGATLLALTNALDKNLEAFLSEKQTDTVTLVTNKDTRHLENPSTSLGTDLPPLEPARPEPAPAPAPRRPYVHDEAFTKDQIAEAKARRAQETRQLEARMGRTSHFQKSADGIVFTLPLEPKRRAELPTELRAVQSVQLIIPLLYPLQPLKILLNDVESKDAELLEESFAKTAAQQRQRNLMSHLNYLAQNLHVLAKQPRQPATSTASVEKQQPEDAVQSPGPPTDQKDKGHIHVIARPPEWVVVGESDSDSDSEYTWDSEDDSDGGAVIGSEKEGGTASVTPQPERGTSISFPAVELHNIELLEVSLLSINAKCERCRTINEITGLRPNTEKASSCKKCATALTAQFRPEMVHQNSVRAGFIDCSGFTIADMLPRQVTFVPTCARCSTASPGIVSVRGEVTTNVCRECHGRFQFKIPQVKFLAITRGGPLPPPTGRRRQEEKLLGLHVGEALPGRGACAHYRRSYRWFRFSCCDRVHACDRCHDGAADHPHEWANRMVCGFCSREQNYAVDACGFCGRSVVGRKGRGFWEGGKGTRDRAMMSRKDKRKFRRVGGGEARKKD